LRIEGCLIFSPSNKGFKSILVGAASSRDQQANDDERLAAGSRSHSLKIYCMNLSEDIEQIFFAQQCLPAGHALPTLSNGNFDVIFR
jgi:hypothetical protein